MRLTTERLTLRPFATRDVAIVHTDIASDYAVVRQTGKWPWPADIAFTESRCLSDAALRGEYLAIESDDRLIGFVGITDGVLGYMLSRPAWGQGFATEAVRAKIDQAFARSDLDQITACVWFDNPASARVLEKCGFVPAGAFEEYCTARNAVVANHTYRLTRTRWMARSLGEDALCTS